MAAIAASEVADLLREAIARRVPVALLGDESWRDAYCGNVEYRVGEWLITFFNDCYEPDYVDSATAPDGRTVEYADWFAGDGSGVDPIDLLSIAGESNALLTLLESIERC